MPVPVTLTPQCFLTRSSSCSCYEKYTESAGLALHNDVQCAKVDAGHRQSRRTHPRQSSRDTVLAPLYPPFAGDPHATLHYIKCLHPWPLIAPEPVHSLGTFVRTAPLSENETSSWPLNKGSATGGRGDGGTCYAGEHSLYAPVMPMGAA